MKLLFVTPNGETVEQFLPALARKGIEVVHAAELEKGLRTFRRRRIELVVVDATGANVNGELACQMFRQRSQSVVLIVVTDKSRSACRSADFLIKPPLSVRKLMYRVRKYLQGSGGEVLRSGDITLHVKERRVVRGAKESHLTPKLTRLLSYFMRNPGQELTRKAIMRAVWDTEYVGDTQTLDVHICWLRKSVEDDPRNPTCIRTVRGVGYRFDPVG